MGAGEVGGVKRGGRRALGVINQNLVGAQPYPCVVKKRAMSQKIVFYEEETLPNPNPNPNPVQRPITRKLAAQIANNQQKQQHECLKEEKNKKKLEDPSFTSSRGVGDCKFEEYKEVAMDHLPVPMSPEQAGAAAADQTEEVEMEDIFEDPVTDIDGRDTKNPLAVVEYIADLYSNYKRMEGCSSVPSDYMSQQLDINENMRAILIDWLIEVHYKFELREETLFLTVNLIDRFLARQTTVARKRLQLVGLVAMLLACKYEEVSVPVVDDFIFISDKAYTRRDLLDMEKLVLNTLQFNLSTPTPYVFMRRFLKAAESDSDSDQKLELLSFFLMELCLVEYEMLKYPPSLLAAAAVYTAQCTVYGTKHYWNKTCQWHTNYSEHQLLECCRHMVGFHQKAGTGKLTGVHRKYSTSKFGFAAKCVPALFLIDS